MRAADDHSGRRIEWLDVARGIGIVLVVHGHVLRGLMSAGLANDPWGFITDFLVYLFHMPLFFFLAGTTAEGSLRKGSTRFVGDKLRTLAYPYFLWSIIQGAIMLALSGAVNNPITVADLAAIPWSPMWQFWFLWALFVCHIAFLAFARSRLALAVAGSVSLMIGIALPDTDNIVTKTLYEFGFYAAGILLAPRLLTLSARPRARTVWLLVAAFALAGVAAMQIERAPLTLSGLPGAVFGVLMVLTVSRRIGGRLKDVFASLGRMSMTIFVLHILAGSGVRIILVKLGVVEPLALHVVAGTVAAVGLSVIAHKILERVDLLAALGLASRRRAVRLAVTH